MVVVGKSSQGGTGTGESEEEGRRNGGRGRERREQGRREDSPVSSPSSGYNSSGPGGNGEVGGREADGQEEDDMAQGLGKHLRGLEEERGGLEEQLLIDLSSPGEEGTPATWDGVKLVMPKSNSQEQTGNVVHTQRYESGQQRETSMYTVGNHPSHCCHHSSCHSSQSHKQSQVIWKQEAEVKSCHNANCRSSAATGLCTTCQSGESQPKQPNHQSQRSGRRMDKGISSPGTGNEIEASPGSQRSTLNSTQDVRSERESCGSRRRTASRRAGPDPSPNRSTCSPSPSRRPGWTDFSDDEDLSFTRWEST